MKTFITIFLIFLFAFSIYAQKQTQVTVTSTFLRKAPDSSSEKVYTVQKGDKLTLEKKTDTFGWYYVSLKNGTIKGWIRADTVGSPLEVVKETTNAPVNAGNNAVQRPQRIVSVPKMAADEKTAVSQTSSPANPVVTQTSFPTKPPVEEEEVVKIETEEVSLNVRVVDTNNRTVKNLKQSDFKIYEDGVLQPISSLNTTEIPMLNALVIDNSRSLRSQLANIIEAGKTIIGTNRPKDESAVIRFVSSDKIEIVQDFTSKKNLLNNGLNNLFVEGGQTAIIDAVYMAARKIGQYQNSAQKDDTRLRALIVVSDGDDRGSSHNEEELFKLLRESQVQIYAIGFVDNLINAPDAGGVNRWEKAKTFLNRLTQETGGKVYFPNSVNELPQIAADISGELHTQYLVSYIPTNDSRDGAFRKIKVLVNEDANKEKRIAITRTGRTSAPK
jgi:Ca-activated chloride channel family protein